MRNPFLVSVAAKLAEWWLFTWRGWGSPPGRHRRATGSSYIDDPTAVAHAWSTVPSLEEPPVTADTTEWSPTEDAQDHSETAHSSECEGHAVGDGFQGDR